MLSKFLIALGLLLVLAIAAVLIGPSFVDWNRYKPEIAAKVKEATGRDLTIAGDVSLRILPVPTFSAERVRFANMEGGSAPDMATFDALRVRVAALPLLQGRVQVERVELARPVILLETSADGRNNWDLGRGAGQTQGQQAGGGTAGAIARGLDISLDRVFIENGTVIYRDDAAGTERKAERLDAEIAAETLRGPFRATGRAVVGGTPLSFGLSTGLLAPGQTAGLGLNLRLVQADAELQFSGSVTLQGAESRLRGKLDGKAPDLGRLVASLSPAGRGAEGPAAGKASLAALGDLAINGNLDATPAAVALSDVSFRVGGTSGSGRVDLVPGMPAKAKVNVALSRVDLDALVAATAARQPASGGGGTAQGEATQEDATQGGGGFALPEGIDAEFDVTAAALTYRDRLINNLRLAATLSGGRLKIDRLTALLPGGSDILLAGSLAAADGAPLFAGTVEANATNFRGLLEMLQVDLADVPSERLRNMSLVSQITATPTRIDLADIDLRLDVSRVRGGIVIALPGNGGPPGLGIGLAVDQVDLDAYRPAASHPAAAAAAGAAAQPLLDSLAPLAGLAANLDLRFGTLTYNGQSLRNVHLDGTVQNGTLTLRELSAKQFAGGEGRLSGKITDLGGTPRFETQFDLATKDAGHALQLAGLASLPPEGLGALTLGGSLSGGADAVAYDVTFSAPDIGAKGLAKGNAAGLGAGLPQLDSRFEITAQDPGPLLRLANLPAEAGSRLGALSLTGNAAKKADGFTYDLSVTAEGVGGHGRLEGEVAGLAATPRIDSRLEMKVEDPAPLLALAGRQAPSNKLEPLSVDATARGTTEALTISDLAVQAGPSRLTGRIDIDNAGQRPRVVADLQGKELALGWLAAAGGQSDGRGAGEKAAGGASGGGGRWPDEPFDLSALEAVDGEISLVADALRFGETRIEDAQLSLTLDQGALDLKRLTGKAYGGTIGLEGRLTNGSIPAVTAKLAARDMAIEQLNPGGALARQVRGPVSLDADLRAKGFSIADLIGALQGTGKLEGTVTVLAPAGQTAGSVLLGLLGSKIGAVRGVTDRIDALYSAFTGGPNKLSGSFRIEDGVLRTDDTALTNAEARAALTGSADLEAWNLDMTARIHRPATDEKPILTLDLRGPIDEPNLDLSGAILSGIGAPADALDLKQPEGLIRDLLQQALPDRAKQPATKEPASAPAKEPTPSPETPAAKPPAAEAPAPQAEEPGSFGALLPKLLEELKKQ